MKMILKIKPLVSLAIALTLTLSVAKAQSTGDNLVERDSVVRSTSIYFKFDIADKIDSMNQQQMSDLIFWIKDNQKARINICGWADPIGANEYNVRLSARRAQTATRYLVDQGIDQDRIHYKGMGVDRNAQSNALARRSTVMAVLDIEIEQEDKSMIDKPMIEEEPVAEKQEMAVIEDIAVAIEPVVEDSETCGGLSLRTNLLYLAATSFNLGMEWNPCNTNLGFIVNGGYAPFGGDGYAHNMGAAFIAPEVRYYIGEQKRWFAGVSFLAGLYNYKLSDTGYQGSVYAGGITGGYKLELSKTFDMDFSLGLGYGQLKYDKYYNNGVGNVLIESDKIKNTVMPIQAGVSLIWKIF